MGAVRLDRVFAQPQIVGDLLVQLTLDYATKNLDFPFCQAFLACLDLPYLAPFYSCLTIPFDSPSNGSSYLLTISEICTIIPAQLSIDTRAAP